MIVQGAVPGTQSVKLPAKCSGTYLTLIAHGGWPADLRKDLHNFSFLGSSGRIGLACDWVWFNVPHGPQKQIRSFFHIQKLLRKGQDKVHFCLQLCWAR